MDYDRLALFLATCTSRNFQRSLQTNPHATLLKCGFHPGEAAALAGAAAKNKGLQLHDIERFSFDFQSITQTNLSGKPGKSDWITGH
jgi:hypothetical protein